MFGSEPQEFSSRVKRNLRRCYGYTSSLELTELRLGARNEGSVDARAGRIVRVMLPPLPSG